MSRSEGKFTREVLSGRFVGSDKKNHNLLNPIRLLEMTRYICLSALGLVGVKR